jgi:predicted 3-demethylubiquinone-9 3-methyltransferase (glyoxalase superfamily)
MQKITPFLWFDDNAEEAVSFYTSLFSAISGSAPGGNNSKIGSIARYDEEGSKISGRPKESLMTASFQLDGQDFVALNGGPIFKFTQAISFYVYCESDGEIENFYQSLLENGTALMPLGKYDWSSKYAWVKDKFGLSWQLDIDTINSSQKILPSLLFVNEKSGRVKEAITYYSSIFPSSRIIMEFPFDKSANLPGGTLLFAQFGLTGYLFNSMSSTLKHDFDFNESISFMVNCDTQEEIDHYWSKLSEGGDEKAQQCGWLKDKFGVSWQIVPTILNKLMNNKDAAKSQKVMHAILGMKKIVIADLVDAAAGS